jgi:hypothetical protein
MDTDMKLFLQFQKFMEMQKTMETQKAPSDASSVCSGSQESLVWRKVTHTVRKIDYVKVMNSIMGKMNPWVSSDEHCSRNPGLFWVFKNLYLDFPERFQLVGELHTSADNNETYFSFAYIRGDKKVNFHAHGQAVGMKFTCTHLDIFLSTKESYYSAANFYKSHA